MQRNSRIIHRELTDSARFWSTKFSDRHPWLDAYCRLIHSYSSVDDLSAMLGSSPERNALVADNALWTHQAPAILSCFNVPKTPQQVNFGTQHWHHNDVIEARRSSKKNWTTKICESSCRSRRVYDGNISHYQISSLRRGKVSYATGPDTHRLYADWFEQPQSRRSITVSDCFDCVYRPKKRYVNWNQCT